MKRTTKLGQANNTTTRATMSVATKRNDLDYVSVSHPSGSSVEVCLYGCTITSFKSEGREHLFVSEKAVLDGSKPIRGGVPLVFPQFGPGPLPNHGFARTSTWSFLGDAADEDSSSVRLSFELRDSEATRALWPHAFVLTFRVTLFADALSCDLEVHNPGAEAFPFQALLHTYYSVADATVVKVEGLKGLSYVDKVADSATVTEEGDDVMFAQEVDRVYVASPAETFLRNLGPSSDGKQTVNIGLTKGLTRITASEQHEAVPLPCDIVVWNPWVEKAQRTGDLGDDEYKVFFCAEPGVVSEPCAVVCGPGERLILHQNIHVVLS